MNASRTSPESPWPALLKAALAGLLAQAAVISLAALLLSPPRQDLEQMALFLTLSGLPSLALGYLALRLAWRLRWGGLRLKTGLAVVVGILVALVNVAVTAFLMFISPHDLALLALLLVFALLLSLTFGFLLAATMTTSLRQLLAGAERMAAGDLSVRVAVPPGDELGDLARAFNTMAAQVEDSFQHRREVEQARKDLVGAVSHDLRTPLASLQVMVEAVNDGVVSDPATIERYLHTMQAEITSLSALVNDLFELSQLDAGVLGLQLEAASIQELISDTLAGLRPQAGQRQLRLDGAAEAALPAVLMDPGKVQRVLYNLVQNAIRHTPADGTVLLSARDVGEAVEVSVVDSGEGIAAADLPHVFERFYRGDPARARAQGGAGLGLAIARGIVEAHGGRIWAESAPGRGSRFTFTLLKAPATEGSRLTPA
ncbi:MAG: sensor histidine kinase [Chloroflexota bacterium]